MATFDQLYRRTFNDMHILDAIRHLNGVRDEYQNFNDEVLRLKAAKPDVYGEGSFGSLCLIASSMKTEAERMLTDLFWKIEADDLSDDVFEELCDIVYSIE